MIILDDPVSSLDHTRMQAVAERLAVAVRAKLREQWIEENREAIEDHNRRIEEHGLWSDGLRRF